MTTHIIGEILLDLALLFGLTYLVGGLLERIRIPNILAALFVAMIIHYTPLGARLLTPEIYGSITFLAQIGVIFLLFYIGLQVNLGEIRGQSKDIFLLTFLNTFVPFVFGMVVMLIMGYGWLLAFVIGLTLMPTAEAVIVPILDEFNLVHTRVGQFIIGAGVLDDVLEVFMVTFVSIWIGERAGGTLGHPWKDILILAMSLLGFLFLSWTGYRWWVPFLFRWMLRGTIGLIILALLILFFFGGLAAYTELGLVLGAITAGIVFKPVLDRWAEEGKEAEESFKTISYGFLGIIFFFWVGLSADLAGILRNPLLVIFLYLAGTGGKLLGVFCLVPIKKINIREAWTVGVGLNARLTTEIVVAQLLYSAKLIDLELFTALIAAASFTTITVPLVFSLLVRKWGPQLKIKVNHG
jgi:Ca2+-transporting ATPase